MKNLVRDYEYNCQSNDDVRKKPNNKKNNKTDKFQKIKPKRKF